VNRLPIRARLTLAFAVAMVAVLATSAAFVYVRLRDDLNESIDAGLRSQAAAVSASGSASAGAAGESEEGFAQLVGADGRVVGSAGGLRGPALTLAQLERAKRGPLWFERRLAGLEGEARVLARPAARSSGARVVAVGRSLDDRNETLSGLVTSFAIGGPAAVLLASIAGYLLAASGLRPVEAMRRRASEISVAGDAERLPVPRARDEVQRLGETLNEMLDRLRRSFERERRFVADAGHELRTPIAVVKAELEAALRSGDYGPQVREALAAAVEECDRLAQLAEDLLVVARSGEGALPLHPEPLAVGALLEDVRERFADRAAQRGRGIHVEAPPNGLRVEADPLRLRQALSNLVDNALRHGAGEVMLRARRAGGGIELEVADDGPGFDPSIAGRAFERFARGDAARSGDGAGLGLAIVRTLVEAHGGQAEIAAGGQGATVRLWLPAEEPAQGHLS
jgi:two-component system OmpR family sensor kinase